jgi:hypothetical protein
MILLSQSVYPSSRSESWNSGANNTRVSVCVSPPCLPGICLVVKQQLGKHVPVTRDTHVTLELLDVSFSVQFLYHK